MLHEIEIDEVGEADLNETEKNLQEEECVAVDEVVDDVEDRKACTGYVDEADDAFNEADNKSCLFLGELELIGDSCRDAFDDGEQRVDRKRDQAEIEDEREDHVEDRA